MTTETKSFDSELENMQDLSESELEAALGNLGLQGEPAIAEEGSNPAPGEQAPARSAEPEANETPSPKVPDPAESKTEPAPPATPPTNEGENPSRVSVDIAEKLEQTMKLAQEAIDAGEFVSARKLLDEVPESRRTPEVNELLTQCSGMMEYEQLWLKAKKYVQKEDYVAAVESLESIPEALRTQQMTNMLHVAQNQATVTLAIQSAKDTLKEYHFKGAIEILEGVPKERRSDALIELLRETYRITRRLDDLRLEGEKRFQKALMGVTMEHLESDDDSFDKVLEIYQEILELCPIDEEARDRAEKAANYIELSKEREELQEYARLHIEDKHFRDALECLKKVHPDVQTGPIREQIIELEGIIEQIDEIREQILQNFQDSDFEDTAAAFEKLKVLHEGEYNRLLKEILGDELENSLDKVFQKLKDSENEDPALVNLLDYLMNAISLTDFENLLADCEDSLLDYYPVSGKGLYQKLIKILSMLTEDHERFTIRLNLLKKYRQHLKEAEPNLTAWEELLETLDHFSQLQSMPWKLKDRWLENDQTNLIETIAYRVADTANCALPQCEDRWQRLLKVAGPQLGFTHSVSKHLYKQIEKYLTVGSWTGKKVCIVTRRMALLLGLGGISSIVVMELLKIYYDIFFKSGGFSAVLASFLLFLIYGTFCILANRWIEE